MMGKLASTLLLLLCVQVFASTAFGQADALLAVQTDMAKHSRFERRRNDVMEFVHANHKKMETLLIALEESKPEKFRFAINRISKTMNKIKPYKNRRPERYAVLIERWKVKSEIELLTARLANREDEAVRAQLNLLIESFVDNREELLALEQRHLRKRLARTERLLEVIKTDRESVVEKNVRSIERTIDQLKSSEPAKE